MRPAKSQKRRSRSPPAKKASATSKKGNFLLMRMLWWLRSSANMERIERLHACTVLRLFSSVAAQTQPCQSAFVRLFSSVAAQTQPCHSLHCVCGGCMGSSKRFMLTVCVLWEKNKCLRWAYLLFVAISFILIIIITSLVSCEKASTVVSCIPRFCVDSHQ